MNTTLNTVGDRAAKRVHLATDELNKFGQYVVLCGRLVPYMTSRVQGPATCARCKQLAADLPAQ